MNADLPMHPETGYYIWYEVQLDLSKEVLTLEPSLHRHPPPQVVILENNIAS